ncbi:peptidase inhibitor family I36 protein [Micromonospora sediminicola]|uniref:peptidase inhibitor family I36 protein n=1 Tax=Micromonospora sediminicola TaxID=946078 RepID=UPI00378D9A94
MRFGRIASVVAVAGAVILSAASPAIAGQKNGVVESGEFGLYWGTGSTGLVYDISCGDGNLAGDKFPGSTALVNDNTMSYRNKSTYTWRVYTDAYTGGAYGTLPPGHVGNASKTFQNSISSEYAEVYGCLP